ncbi:MAG: hypothetical protein WA431_08225 [Candidatus Cybelea sp.]
MTLRKVPGALALGLLASLAAHAALFGGTHVMGGAYAGLLAQAASAGCFGLVLCFAALAWSGSRLTAEGTILAARLRERLPGAPALFTCASLWYMAAEAVEPHHAGVAPAVAVITLAVAAWLSLRLARAVVGALALAAIAIQKTTFTPRTPSWKRRLRLRPIRRRAPLAHRRFARPPPIAIVL